jgi:hypothetical protein
MNGRHSKVSYILQQFSWASISELFEFHEQQLPLAGWGIKGWTLVVVIVHCHR